jgi:pyruvate,water dikinase
MVQQLGNKGVSVPGGFATTSDAFRAYLAHNDLNAFIKDQVERFDDGRVTLQQAGEAVRAAIFKGEWPDDIRKDILTGYKELSERTGTQNLSVAVRSSGDRRGPARGQLCRPAGNLSEHPRRGGPARRLPALLCLALHRPGDHLSPDQGFRSHQVALSVGVQQMVRSDTGGSGVMFSIDTESGFPDKPC